MFRVSINGGEPVSATSVVLYNDESPIALGMKQGGAILFCDSIRDKNEFMAALDLLGITIDTERTTKCAGTLQN